MAVSTLTIDMNFRCCGLIPFYNHPGTVGDVVASLRRLEMPVILVNDGSSADASKIVEALAAEDEGIHLLTLPVNQGKGGAVKAGLMLANRLSYTHALQLDADGQHDVGEAPQLMRQAMAQPEAIISGRPVFDDDIPKVRYYGRYLTHILIWINTLSFKIADAMCGFRVYPVAATCRIIERGSLGNGMDFDPEILVRWSWAGSAVLQLPVIVKYPTDGISHFRGWKDNGLISWMHTRLFFGMLLRCPVLIFRKTAILRKKDGCRKTGGRR